MLWLGCSQLFSLAVCSSVLAFVSLCRHASVCAVSFGFGSGSVVFLCLFYWLFAEVLLFPSFCRVFSVLCCLLVHLVGPGPLCWPLVCSLVLAASSFVDPFMGLMGAASWLG